MGSYPLPSADFGFGQRKVLETESGGDSATLGMKLLPLKCKLKNG